MHSDISAECTESEGGTLIKGAPERVWDPIEEPSGNVLEAVCAFAAPGGLARAGADASKTRSAVSRDRLEYRKPCDPVE
jgi:hypothetical protein